MRHCYPFLIVFLLIGQILQAQTENVGIGTDNPTGKLTIADTSKTALTIRTTDNAFPAGIAFQNSGLAYTWSIYRNDIGSNQADLIFANGQNSDVEALTPLLTLKRSNEVDIHGNARISTLGGGAGLRPVFADSTGRLVFNKKTESETSTVNAGFQDDGCEESIGLTDIITIAGKPHTSGSNVSVTVNLSHSFLTDVELFLVSPQGDTLKLLSDQGPEGGNSDLVNTTFSDQGVLLSNGNAPFTGLFQPDGSLDVECGISPTISSFSEMGEGNLIDPNGDWKLLVFDDLVAPSGVLNNWTINISLPDQGEDQFVPVWNNGALAKTSSIFDNGNVGIGTTSPPGKLSVLESKRNALTIKTPDNSLPAGIAFQNSGSNYTWSVYREDAGSNTAHLVFSGGQNADPDLLNPSLVLGANGNVGVGTAIGGGLIVPAADLHVFKTSGMEPVLKLESPSVGAWNIDVTGAFPIPNLEFSNGFAPPAVLNGITGAWNAPSDLRLKKDISSLSGILEDVQKLEAKKYHFNTQEEVGPFSIGFIAQEVKEIFPEAVQYHAERDIYTMNYDVFGVLAIQAIKEQQSIIDNQEARIQKLEKQVEALLKGK